MRREVSKQQQLTRLGIAFVIFVLGSIYYYHRDEAQAESVNALFNDTVFGIPDVSTRLSYYSDTHELLSIKITATGLPEPAREYKPHLLAFICSQPSLKAILLRANRFKTWTGTNSKLGQAFKIKTRNDSIIRGCFLIGP